MKVPGQQVSQPIGVKVPFKKHGRIPRRWVFLSEDDRPFAYLKVPRRIIREIEDIADSYGWCFDEAVVQLIRAGLKTHFLKTDSLIGALDVAREGIAPGGEHDEPGQA